MVKSIAIREGITQEKFQFPIFLEHLYHYWFKRERKKNMKILSRVNENRLKEKKK